MSFPPRLPIPKEVLDIARKLEAAGHESWCVGGAVRDNLLGLENKDFDLATSATPEQVRRLFRRSIPIGVEHGTVAVLDRKRQPARGLGVTRLCARPGCEPGDAGCGSSVGWADR